MITSPAMVEHVRALYQVTGLLSAAACLHRSNIREYLALAGNAVVHIAAVIVGIAEYAGTGDGNALVIDTMRPANAVHFRCETGGLLPIVAHGHNNSRRNSRSNGAVIAGREINHSLLVGNHVICPAISIGDGNAALLLADILQQRIAAIPCNISAAVLPEVGIRYQSSGRPH